MLFIEIKCFQSSAFYIVMKINVSLPFPWHPSPLSWMLAAWVTKCVAYLHITSYKTQTLLCFEVCNFCLLYERIGGWVRGVLEILSSKELRNLYAKLDNPLFTSFWNPSSGNFLQPVLPSKDCQISQTPGETASEVRRCPCFHWKAEFKGFPMVYDTPILLNIGMSYTIGKLLTSAFQCLEVRKRVTAYLLPSSLRFW